MLVVVIKTRKKKRSSRSKRQNKFRRTLTTLAPIVQRQRSRANCSQEKPDYFSLRLNIEHQAEECPILSSQLGPTLLQQCESSKRVFSYKRNGSPSGGRPEYYGGLVNPSHRLPTKATVAHGVKNTGTTYQTGSSFAERLMKPNACGTLENAKRRMFTTDSDR